MDSPADALLALSNTAVAIADSNETPIDDDDRSSSLSELEDAPDNMDLEDEEEDDAADEEDVDDDEPEEADEDHDAVPARDPLPDGDSEAETERLEESPDKTRKAFQISPSKLAQSMNASDHVRPEIEELTNSEVSSPMTPIEDSPLDELSEAEDALEDGNPLNVLSQAAAVTNKRKRLSDVMDIALEERPRKRRTDSLSEPEDDEDADSEPESEAGKPEVPTREPTVEPDGVEAPEEEKEPQIEAEEEKASSSDTSKSKKPEQYTRSRSRRGKDAMEDAQDEEDNEAEASDEEVEQDDVDAVAKSEEEQAKRAAAMDALSALEHHFASLRDKLYDDKISQINHELSQLSAVEPDHPELLKQFECINKYRDEKQETEMQLLVHRVGALKRKSVAERSQLHSAYFQTIRDVRERHMERMSEHFYRIQRERFKSTQVTPSYTVPFPDKRVTQVTHQSAYNKEVSILSGVAKYVGFPAAPTLQDTQEADLNADLQKMGIHSTSARIRNAAQARHAALSGNSAFPTLGQGAISALSSSAAAASATTEQQFIESTPWANPNHPIHRLGRQANKSPFADAYISTPSNQNKRNGTGIEYTPAAIPGSASTIDQNPSTTNPTPAQSHSESAIKNEAAVHANGISLTNGDSASISPSETRRTINNMLQAGATAAAQQARVSSGTPQADRDGHGIYLGVNSSPLQARASLLSSLNRTASAAGVREGTKSPFRHDLMTSAAAAGGGSGMGRFGFR